MGNMIGRDRVFPICPDRFGILTGAASCALFPLNGQRTLPLLGWTRETVADLRENQKPLLAPRVAVALPVAVRVGHDLNTGGFPPLELGCLRNDFCRVCEVWSCQCVAFCGGRLSAARKKYVGVRPMSWERVLAPRIVRKSMRQFSRAALRQAARMGAGIGAGCRQRHITEIRPTHSGWENLLSCLELFGLEARAGLQTNTWAKLRAPWW